MLEAPASTADFTAPTSPRTITVTSPEPIFSVPTKVTFAALHMVSAASIAAVSPLVSTIPNASCAIILFLLKMIKYELFFAFIYTTLL